MDGGGSLRFTRFSGRGDGSRDSREEEKGMDRGEEGQDQKKDRRRRLNSELKDAITKFLHDAFENRFRFLKRDQELANAELDMDILKYELMYDLKSQKGAEDELKWEWVSDDDLDRWLKNEHFAEHLQKLRCPTEAPTSRRAARRSPPKEGRAAKTDESVAGPSQAVGPVPVVIDLIPETPKQKRGSSASPPHIEEKDDIIPPPVAINTTPKRGGKGRARPSLSFLSVTKKKSSETEVTGKSDTRKQRKRGNENVRATVSSKVKKIEIGQAVVQIPVAPPPPDVKVVNISSSSSASSSSSSESEREKESDEIKRLLESKAILVYKSTIKNLIIHAGGIKPSGKRPTPPSEDTSDSD